jgi:hypothetical protein
MGGEASLDKSIKQSSNANKDVVAASENAKMDVIATEDKAKQEAEESRKIKKEDLKAKKEALKLAKKKAKKDAKEARKAKKEEEKAKKEALKLAKKKAKKDAKAAREKAKRDAIAAEETARKEAEEAKKAKKEEEIARKEAEKLVKDEAADIEVVETINITEISGGLSQNEVKLIIMPPIDSVNLREVEKGLRNTADLRVLLIGGTADGGMQIVVSAAESVPILNTLRGMPQVEKAEDKDNTIYISLKWTIPTTNS